MSVLMWRMVAPGRYFEGHDHVLGHLPTGCTVCYTVCGTEIVYGTGGAMSGTEIAYAAMHAMRCAEPTLHDLEAELPLAVRPRAEYQYVRDARYCECRTSAHTAKKCMSTLQCGTCSTR
eukprot:3941517-Rhodomonas_salina.3